MASAIERGKFCKKIHRDRIGQDFILCYDECKRMLVLCSSTKLELHVFIFDETFGSMQTLVGGFSLSLWYDHGTSISHASFVTGKEAVVLIDSSGRARIFSLITMQFQPALLQLQSIPNDVLSSPDGSCLLTSHIINSQLHFAAYHWSTFGSTAGIALGALDLPTAQRSVLTSFHRRQIHLMCLDVANHECRSIALHITRKITEFMFQQEGTKYISHGPTVHNSLIDCHSEVWTRFPVVPAVRRHTISSASKRHKKLLFSLPIGITSHLHPTFPT